MEEFGHIYYTKKIEISYEEAFPLFYQLYSDKKWIDKINLKKKLN